VSENGSSPPLPTHSRSFAEDRLTLAAERRQLGGKRPRSGKSAKDGEGMTAHFAVPDLLSDAMERVRRGGGEVMSEVIDIPIGSFFYAKDTEGNSLGLFKYKN
jgi:predicted enzyme related to lactoylglutathione lyase